MTRLCAVVPRTRRSRASPASAAHRMHPCSSLGAPMYAIRQGAQRTSMRWSDPTASSALLSQPVVAKGAEPRQRLPVSDAVGGRLARDDVVEVADREPLDLDMPTPRLLERLDPVRRKHEIEVERATLQLNEVLAALDLRRLRVAQREAELAQRRDHSATVRRCLLDEQVGVLSRIGKAEEDGARLAEEEVAYAVAVEDPADLLRLRVVKLRGHTRASSVDSSRTRPGTRPSYRTSGKVRRRAPACRSG